jgi:glyceraldehyde 3-phosphate dehydrogenase
MPWSDLGVDIVVEATHAFRRRADLEGHLAAGARRVLLSTPPLDAIDRILLHGVNHQDLSPGDRLVSCGSSTTQALALMLKILDEAAGVEAAMKTTVHAYTSDQTLADAAGANLRLSRSAAENLIPNASWSPGVVETILPALKGRLDGIAINVPVSNGSNLDLAVQLRRPLTSEEINRSVAQAAAGPCARWLEYSEEPLVSRDVIGNPKTGVFDALATLALPTGLAKTVTWYDNGWGYAARIVETIEAMAAQGGSRS